MRNLATHLLTVTATALLVTLLFLSSTSNSKISALVSQNEQKTVITVPADCTPITLLVSDSNSLAIEHQLTNSTEITLFQNSLKPECHIYSSKVDKKPYKYDLSPKIGGKWNNVMFINHNNEKINKYYEYTFTNKGIPFAYVALYRKAEK
jgi:hypothetical protein